MTPKDKEGENHHSWSSKQREDPGYTPLGLDEGNDPTKALSPLKIHPAAHMAPSASRRSVPLSLPFKDVRARAKADFAFYNDGNMQGRIS
jgi:hypothetical protein